MIVRKKTDQEKNMGAGGSTMRCWHCGRQLDSIEVENGHQVGCCKLHGWVPCDRTDEEAIKIAAARNRQMDEAERRNCYICGIASVKQDGAKRIIYCPRHRWVPKDPKDQAAKEAAGKANRKQRSRKAFASVSVAGLMVLSIAAAIFWFYIRPLRLYEEREATETKQERETTEAEQDSASSPIGQAAEENGQEATESAGETVEDLPEYGGQTVTVSLENAATLAAQGNEQCLELLKEAKARGGSIEETAFLASKHFPLGITRLELLGMAAGSSEGGGVEEARSLFAGEMLSFAASEEAGKLEAGKLRSLFDMALEQALPEEQLQSIFEIFIPLIAAKEQAIHQEEFWNADSDGAREYLALTDDGRLILYDWKDGGIVAHEEKQPIDDGSFFCEGTFLFISSADHTAFAVYSCQDAGFTCHIAIQGVTSLAREGNIVYFEQSLAGSVPREGKYRYDLSARAEQAELIFIDWHPENYPMPSTPEEAAVRCLEALCYGTAGEMERLCEEKKAAEDFKLPVPDGIEAIRVQSFFEEEDRAFVEASYRSAGETAIRYMEVGKNGSGWCLATVMESLPSIGGMAVSDHDTPLLALNVPVEGELAKRGESRTWRVLIPEYACVSLLWQAGRETGEKAAFEIVLYEGTNVQGPLFSYSLTLSAAVQASDPLFLAPGIYYIAVKALTSEGRSPFTLHLTAETGIDMERERNDTEAEATPVAMGKAYAGSLYKKEDTDYFAFSLTEPSGIRLRLSSNPSGNRRSCFSAGLYREGDAQSIVEALLSGEDGEAVTPAVYLGAGSYRICVARGNDWSTRSYSIMVEPAGGEGFEIEPNNTMASATPVETGKKIEGSIVREGDVDYFAFHLPEDALVRLSLSFAPMESSQKAYEMTIYKNGKALKTARVRGKESGRALPEWPLAAGDYVLELKNPLFEAREYAIQVIADAIPRAEREPNDTLAQAQELEDGVLVTALLDNMDDVDTYRLYVMDDEMLTLFFNSADKGDGRQYYTLSLEGGGRTFLSKTSDSMENGKFSVPLHFSEEGEYYLKAAGGKDYTGECYTIGTEKTGVKKLE